MTHEELAARLRADGATADLRLLVLYGSRARDDASPESDWDFAYLAGEDFDVIDANVSITGLLGTNRVDLVDLATATALLRYHAARDGVSLIEHEPDTFLAFRLEASLFWCDVEPVVRAAHSDVLAALA